MDEQGFCHMLPESNYTNNVGETEIVIPDHPGRGPVGPVADSNIASQETDCHEKK